MDICRGREGWREGGKEGRYLFNRVVLVNAGHHAVLTQLFSHGEGADGVPVREGGREGGGETFVVVGTT